MRACPVSTVVSHILVNPPVDWQISKPHSTLLCRCSVAPIPVHSRWLSTAFVLPLATSPLNPKSKTERKHTWVTVFAQEDAQNLTHWRSSIECNRFSTTYLECNGCFQIDTEKLTQESSNCVREELCFTLRRGDSHRAYSHCAMCTLSNVPTQVSVDLIVSNSNKRHRSKQKYNGGYILYPKSNHGWTTVRQFLNLRSITSLVSDSLNREAIQIRPWFDNHIWISAIAKP